MKNLHNDELVKLNAGSCAQSIGISLAVLTIACIFPNPGTVWGAAAATGKAYADCYSSGFH